MAEACAAGVDVRWVPYATADHRSLITPSSPFLFTLLRWTQARFDRDESPISDCGQASG